MTNQKNLKFHIKNQDWFGTKATIVNLMIDSLISNYGRADVNKAIKVLRNTKEELEFLQENFEIIKK